MCCPFLFGKPCDFEALKRAVEAEATVARVEPLVEKWKDGDFNLPDYTRGKMDGRHECAKELQAALKSEPCSECSGSGETAYPPYSKTDPYGDLTTCKTCNGTGLKEQP
jgi:hypothetical protein